MHVSQRGACVGTTTDLYNYRESFTCTMPRRTTPPAPSPVSFKFPDGAVIWTQVNEHSGKREIICDLCGKLIELTRYANPSAFVNHRESARCTRQLRRNFREAAQAVNVSNPFHMTPMLTIYHPDVESKG